MIRMKRNIYMTIGFCCFAFALSGCSEKDEVSESDSGTKIEGIALGMEGTATEVNAGTRTNVGGVAYAVNTNADPTYKDNTTTGSLQARGTAGWKLDLNLYNGKNASGGVDATPYAAGNFTGGVSTNKWLPTSGTYYFPNYFNPYAEAWLYPAAVNTSIATDQSTADKLVAQDILYKAKAVITIAHTPTITLSHKRAMLDFIVGIGGECSYNLQAVFGKRNSLEERFYSDRCRRSGVYAYPSGRNDRCHCSADQNQAKCYD